LESQEKGAAASSVGKKKTYDLNTHNDHFLAKYSSAPFPEAVDANEKELAEISQKESAIRNRPDFAKLSASMSGGISSAENEAMLSSLENKGKDLSEAIESLPEILLKKSILETHTNIMQSLMKRIAQREIPTYFEIEQTILTSNKAAIDRQAIINLLKDETKGNIYDKCRLLGIVAAMSDPSTLTKAINDEYDQAFQQGCQGIQQAAASSPNPSNNNNSVVTNEEITKLLGVIQFLRRLLSLQSGSMTRNFFGNQSSQSSNAILSSFLTSAQSSANSLLAKATSFFTKFTPYNITRIVSTLADGKGGLEDETFVYFDPKQTGNNNAASNFIPGTKYSEVIVFVIGGGCYSEYYNLQELLKEKSTNASGYPRHILYGCTDLLSGDEFIRQIENMLPNSTSTTTTSK
jgi:hypothetical protein